MFWQFPSLFVSVSDCIRRGPGCLVSTALLGLVVPFRSATVENFCSALDRIEVELAVEVRDDYAVAARFALVIMDLSRRLRPHGSRPRALRKFHPEGLTVKQLHKETGIPDKTIYHQLDELYDNSFVEIMEEKRRRGRRPIRSYERPAEKYVLEDHIWYLQGENPLAAGAVDYDNNFLDALHEIVEDKEIEEICSPLIDFVAKVNRKFSESKDRNISIWAPTRYLRIVAIRRLIVQHDSRLTLPNATHNDHA